LGELTGALASEGGVRPCYVYLPEHATVFLVTIYGKNEKEDLTAREKKYIREYVRRIKAELDRRKDQADS
jgi:hypothetical protein